VTPFEYLAIALGLVFTIAAMRLIGGLPHALDPARRYWVHLTLVLMMLFGVAASLWTFFYGVVVTIGIMGRISSNPRVHGARVRMVTIFGGVSMGGQVQALPAPREGAACTFITSGDHEWVRATERMIGEPIRRREVAGFSP